MYDVMRPETLRAIVDFWLPEFDRHATHRDAVKMIVGNKIDMVRQKGTGSTLAALH